MYLLDRQLAPAPKVKAFQKARDLVNDMDPDELRALHEQGRLKDLPGIGDSTGAVIAEALDGKVPAYLASWRPRARSHRRRRRHPRRAERRLPHPLALVGRRGTDRRDGEDRAGARPRVPRDDRPLRPAHRRPRPVGRTPAEQLDEIKSSTRTWHVPRPHGDGGRHPGGRRARHDRRDAGGARRRRGQRALEAEHGTRGDDPPDGDGDGQPHTDILGHCTGRKVVGGDGRRARSTPRSCSQPAPASTRRSRSTAGPSGRTRRKTCCSSASTGAASVDRHRRPRSGPARMAALRLRQSRSHGHFALRRSSTP